MESDPIPPLKTLMARGARKECPRCSQGRLFKRYNILRERCEVCGLKYLEEQGALFGYLFLLDRALFLFPLVVLVYFRAYVGNANWFYLLFTMMLFGLFYTLPHRTGMSVALHYFFRMRRSRGLSG